MALLDRLREHHANLKHDDPKARRAAVRQLGDPALLDEIARTDPEASVRDAATDALLRLAVEGQDQATCLAALTALSDPKHLGACGAAGCNGLLLGLLYLACGRTLAAPIVAHGASNTLAFVLICLGRYPGV